MNAKAVQHVTCSCCESRIEYLDKSQLREDPDLGFLCPDCSYSIKIGVAWLKHFGMKECRSTPQRGA